MFKAEVTIFPNGRCYKGGRRKWKAVKYIRNDGITLSIVKKFTTEKQAISFLVGQTI